MTRLDIAPPLRYKCLLREVITVLVLGLDQLCIDYRHWSLFQSYRNQTNVRIVTAGDNNPQAPRIIDMPQSPLDCNSDLQSAVSYGSNTDLAIISGGE